jgi:hypothetical protein
VVAGPVFAQPVAPEQLVRELSRCDASVFRTIGANRQSMQAYGPLRSRDAGASFVVPDRTDPDKSKVLFKSPMKVGALNIVGFFDEVQRIPDGFMISWGLLVASTVERTALALRSQIWESDRLRKDDQIFVRSEVWSHARPELGWAKILTEAGVPRPGTVERVLLIEPYEGETKFVRLGCSYQGTVTPEMIETARPDLSNWLE